MRKIKSFNDWVIFESKNSKLEEQASLDANTTDGDGTSIAGEKTGEEVDKPEVIDPEVKKSLDSYKKPEGIESSDDMTLCEDALKATVYDTQIPAGSVFNYNNLYIDTDAIENDPDVGGFISSPDQAQKSIHLQNLAKRINEEALEIHVLNKERVKPNNYYNIKPVDATGAMWKVVSKTLPKLGKISMAFTDTAWTQTLWTEKELESNPGLGETRVQLGLWKNIPKENNFRDGDVVYVQMCSQYPHAAASNVLYYVTERKLNKKGEAYKTHFEGGEQIASKDLIVLDTPFPGTSDATVSYGVASLVKRGKKQGGGRTRPAVQKSDRSTF